MVEEFKCPVRGTTEPADGRTLNRGGVSTSVAYDRGFFSTFGLSPTEPVK